jgi:hypothetical protein
MRYCLTSILILSVLSAAARGAPDPTANQLDGQFSTIVRPFLTQYCVTCHGKDSPEGDLDLTVYSSMATAARDSERWNTILDKLEAGKMPPKKAKAHPADAARRPVIDWFHAARDFQTLRNAGDPGVVLARRLSNAEYDYTIRDLTGADIRAAAEFPVDPSNTAGFDNSGESLVMSPSLLKKYLQAARAIADHLVLKTDGITFAPYPMLAETDRDRYCVERIINFYHAQDTNYADYFEAAWRFKNRAAMGTPDATLLQVAAERKLSSKYLALVWEALQSPAEIGPMATLQKMWKALPGGGEADAPAAHTGCAQMRDFVVGLRKKVEPRFPSITIGPRDYRSEPILIWKDVQYATHRMKFDPAQLQVAGEPPAAESNIPEPGLKDADGPGKTMLIKNAPGDPDLVVPAGQRAAYEAAFAKFCSVFPDTFYAGFHNIMGYFRDDQPLYELVLSDDQQKELDGMWRDMDFIASVSSRTYSQFCHAGQHGERGITETETTKPVAAGEDTVTDEASIKALEASYLVKAQASNDPRTIDAVTYYFTMMNDNIRWTETAKAAAEPSHLEALLQFAARAYRRPLSKQESDDLLAWYQSCRKQGLDHEAAMREAIVSVLLSPDFCYRIDLLGSGPGVHALSDYELASRLSYFLWSSMPDAELLSHAAAGGLHQPAVMTAEARRMLADARVRALAVEFGGAWLDFRRFDEIATVDHDRFPSFFNDLRTAMYEEPIHFLVDAFQSNRSMLDLVYGNYTFVNPVLARHYGMPDVAGAANQWVRIDDADQYGRGGLLPMAAFLTKNAPGLRTSPVKRGNWVVKNVLGEKIAAPPPNVPELPRDEAKLDLPLRDMLARHRQDPNCAACHARFDSFGLVFEGFGPIGERRDKDLAGRAIDPSASFPDGSQGAGLAGLKSYIREHRQADFTNNLSRKMLAYALNRSLILSDQLLIQQIDDKLKQENYRLNTLVESIVTSPQFLNQRGPDQIAEK